MILPGTVTSETVEALICNAADDPGTAELVKVLPSELIQRGPSHEDGITLLMLAARAGMICCCHALLAAGAPLAVKVCAAVSSL